MTAVNIAKTEDQPIRISRPEEVTALLVDSSRNSLDIYDSTGEIMFLCANDKRIDLAGMEQKLTDSGVPMVPFTRYMYDGRKRRDDLCFISAAAVSYIEDGKPSEDGTHNITVCVKGIGEMYSKNRPPEEVEALLEAVRKAVLLIEYDPEKVSISKYYPHPLYVNPAAVSQITDRFSSFQLIFGAKGFLDSVEVAGVTHDSVEDIARKLLREDQKKEDSERQYHDIDPLYEEAARLKDQEMQIKADFAKAIAAHGNMIEISDAHCINYTRPQDIAYTDYYDEKKGEDRFRLTVHFNDVTQPNWQCDITVCFGTPQERKAADRKINAAIAAAPKA
jgi:hypothetical protein